MESLNAECKRVEQHLNVYLNEEHDYMKTVTLNKEAQTIKNSNSAKYYQRKNLTFQRITFN